MTASRLRAKVVAERVGWVRAMLASIRTLPLATFADFDSDPRNAAAAESYLRRTLEALLDLGRHVLAKGFGIGVDEYKEIALGLSAQGVIDSDSAALLRQLARYRNRMVHFYHEISHRELYSICSSELGDVERVLDAFLEWIAENPDRLDRSL